jgi:Bacterial Ig domain
MKNLQKPGVSLCLTGGRRTSFAKTSSWKLRAAAIVVLTLAAIVIGTTGGFAEPFVPPDVALTSPSNAATYDVPGVVSLTATASDSDGTISKVEFFQGTTKLCTDTTVPYACTWADMEAGTYSITAKATDNSNAVTTSSAAGITVNPISVPAEGIPCPDNSSSETLASGSLAANTSNRFTITMAPCETLSISVVVNPTFPNNSTPVTVKLYNNSGKELLSQGWSSFGQHTETIPSTSPPWVPPYRGTRGEEGMPAYGKITTGLWSLDNQTVTATRTPRPGYNVGGTSFTNALDVPSLPNTYSGSIHHFETRGQYFKIHLEGSQPFCLTGHALGHTSWAPNFKIELYNAAQQKVTDMVSITPNGVEEFVSSIYTNPSTSPADFYLRVRSLLQPTHDFEMTIAPVKVEIDKTPSAFIPQGGSADNNVQITARVTPSALKGKFKFRLYETSDEKGYCINAPKTVPASGEDSDTWKDLQFPTQTGFTISGTSSSVADTTSTNLDTATVTVKSFDYGSFGKIKVEFIKGLVTYLATETGGTKTYTNIPRDDDENHVADSASQNSGSGASGAATEDADSTPTGLGVSGDRLTRYEEYRGFLVSGTHVRTSVAEKDVFYNDADGVEHQEDWTFNNLGAPIRKITADEMINSGLGDDKSITFNSESHAGPGEKAIRQETNGNPALRTKWWGEATLFIPFLATRNWVHVDQIMSGTTLKDDVTSSQTTIVLVHQPNGPPNWADNGKIAIDGEILSYTSAAVNAGNGTVTLSGVTRGVDGTTAAAHTSGAAVPYFIDADEVIRYIVAHENGHNCNLAHDETESSQMMQIRPGQANLVHVFRRTGTVAGSTQEFTVKY